MWITLTVVLQIKKIDLIDVLVIADWKEHFVKVTVNFQIGYNKTQAQKLHTACRTQQSGLRHSLDEKMKNTKEKTGENLMEDIPWCVYLKNYQITVNDVYSFKYEIMNNIYVFRTERKET
jgi:hypothetical protein